MMVKVFFFNYVLILVFKYLRFTLLINGVDGFHIYIASSTVLYVTTVLQSSHLQYNLSLVTWGITGWITVKLVCL